MKSFRVTHIGHPPSFEDVNRPLPAKGELLVRITACGLNFADLLMIKGQYQDTPDVPFTLGMEVAGIVEAIGPETEGPAIGTRVAIFGGNGGLAEYGVFPAERAVVISDSMSNEIAAGFQVAYGTSHLALSHKARLAKCDPCSY